MAEPLLGGMAHTAADRCEPLLRPGNTNCGGCGMSIALNMLSRAIAEHPVQVVIPACCGIVTAGPFPFSSYGAPVLASTFGAAAAMATGLAHVARLNGERTRVLCWAGDGGTYDIGMATLSRRRSATRTCSTSATTTRSTATPAASAPRRLRWGRRPRPPGG